MISRVEIHRRIRTVILESGITYRELSERSGIPINSITNYTGAKPIMPTADNLAKICKALGASADEILGLEDENGRT